MDKLFVHPFSPDFGRAKRGALKRIRGESHIATISLIIFAKCPSPRPRAHCGKMAHIAKSPHNSLKNNDRFKAHIAPFYLAISPPTLAYSEIAADS
jgi:hypothetical protein